MKKSALVPGLLGLILMHQTALVAITAGQSREKQFTKTTLLTDKEIATLSAEISGAGTSHYPRCRGGLRRYALLRGHRSELSGFF